MKKIFLLFMSLAVLSSCSDDDEANGTSDDRILGTWFLVEVNGIENLPFEINECILRSNVTFNSNNTANSNYYTGTTSENCSLDDEEGRWEKLEGDSKYQLTIPVLGSQRGTVNFSGDNSEFTFIPDLIPAANIVFEKR
ncbi:lipocalin family protein [Autumnicola psychrophila]|uniref:Type IV secretion system putative lipoprotein virB7 n=1 Tax=Autumnicola psychrophila TaxID=3075592 RepID=A0ABU3DR30_9FLAO|nr:lipocalin family protein [Zunongwangia sp. F225]MDT0686171.1 lipocalin family protein [Zunongwangia sp. F225]